jgi:H+/gluconate symporter-like permease
VPVYERVFKKYIHENPAIEGAFFTLLSVNKQLASMLMVSKMTVYVTNRSAAVIAHFIYPPNVPIA